MYVEPRTWVELCLGMACTATETSSIVIAVACSSARQRPLAAAASIAQVLRNPNSAVATVRPVDDTGASGNVMEPIHKYRSDAGSITIPDVSGCSARTGRADIAWARVVRKCHRHG